MKFGLSDAILIFGTRESRRKYDGKRKSHTLHARSRLARRADRRGELREGEKLSGRSKLSPEYNVSPETVRRALRLLADMKVVEVKEQSGVYILSADNARRYLHLCAGRNDLQEKQRRLRRLLAQQEQRTGR